MPALVVGDPAAVLLGLYDLALGAEHDLLDRVGEVGVGHLFMLAPRRQQRRLVGDVGEVGPDHAGRCLRQPSEIDVVGKRHRARVDLEDLLAADLVGRHDSDAAVEPARPQQGAVEDLGRLVAPSTTTPVLPSKPSISVRIWFRRLLALVVAAAEAAAGRPRPPDGVELVDEDDRRGVLGRLLEEVAHTRRADADDGLDELGGRDREERHAGLARDRLREQGLAGSGGARKQYPTRDPRPERLVFLGVLEEVDDLGELFLRVVDPRDVVEGDPGVFALGAPRARPAELTEHTAGPATDARRMKKMNRPTRSSVGPKLKISVWSNERSCGGFAFTLTFALVSAAESSSVLANVGTSVSKCSAPSNFFLKSPWTVSPFDEISSTLPFRSAR